MRPGGNAHLPRARGIGCRPTAAAFLLPSLRGTEGADAARVCRVELVAGRCRSDRPLQQTAGGWHSCLVEAADGCHVSLPHAS